MPLRAVSDLSDYEHSALVEALNDRIRAESWTQDTELLARLVDTLGRIEAQLRAGILTAQPKSTSGFGKAEYPDPVTRPDWITGEDDGETGDDAAAVDVVTPGELARMFLAAQ